MKFFNQPQQGSTKPKIVTIKDYLEGNGVPKLTVTEVIAKARVRLMMTSPFWGMLIAATNIDIVEDPPKGMDTAWTNGIGVYYNMKFFMSLTLTEFNFINAHEVWHMANLHIPRLGAKDPQLWNIATDHWINLTLKEDSTTDSSLSIPDMKRIFPSDPEAGLCMDDKYIDKSPDMIYADIVKEMSSKSEQQRKKAIDKAAGSMKGDLDYEGFNKADGSQEDKAKQLAEYWKGQVAAAADGAKKAGKLPGNIAREVNNLLQPEVDWQSMLAEYISFNPTDYEFTNPDRRFTEWPFVIPDMVGDKLDCAIVIDTSGSISPQMINKFISEAYAITSSFEYVQGTLIGHDHNVHDWHEFDPNNPPPTKLKGGGGTDFFCVFNECKERDYKPDVMIWFTDLYAQIPPKPEFPVLFVIVNSSEQAPEWAASHVRITLPRSW